MTDADLTLDVLRRVRKGLATTGEIEAEIHRLAAQLERANELRVMWKDNHATMERRALAAEQARDRLRHVGAQLANVAYNWKQGHKRHLAEADFKMLADLQRQWDAALRAPDEGEVKS